MKSINPKNLQVIREYQEHSPDEVAAIIEATYVAGQKWKQAPFSERSECLRALAQVLRENKEQYAQEMTDEMGKVKAESYAEVEKCAWVCEYYADHGEAFLQPTEIETDAQRSFVTYQPLGIVLGIMPWNFPLWQVYRYAVPTVMAGNATLLKHAPNVSQCALGIEDAFEQAGFPTNLLRTLLIDTDQTAKVIEAPEVAAVTLTGSTRAGRAVAAKAGECLKKAVLELGGSDPFLVLEDADLDLAVELGVKSRLVNGGQSCIAAKRFVVVDAVYDAFVEKFVAAMKVKTLGDPMEDSTDIGPMARLDLRDELHRQVQESAAQGAIVVIGGELPDLPGAYYPVTVLTDVVPGMPAYSEEFFGPVASVLKAEDEADAIRIANDTSYGLGAAIMTKDRARGERLAEHLVDAGSCFVNDLVHSDPRLPFGGIKESGYGRELGPFGIKEFVNTKTVFVK
ncbi:MAG TPA: succinate-semialdehyde dehydrogenase [Cytophagales bacterium]|nr:succinate-semialdehyde dehydrogenase [Cytophagales bacterium]HAA19251.1 succinate-semialdehyde dehydrogenase [Cytophagales bacterium]HAP62520.1 succinate-semialdehyde dehydrogenase [Cytophagales bacterium]